MFISLLFESPEFYVTWVIIVMFSICIHEYSHAWTAYRCGDGTAVEQGYLTLNPLIVMGPMSLGLLALFGIAWGAVPVNPRRLKVRHGSALVAVSGPGANIALFFLFFAVLMVATMVDHKQIYMIGRTGMLANGFLFLFNMLPVPGLDGWAVYEVVVPPMRKVPANVRGQVGLVLLMIILFTGAYRVFWVMSGWVTDNLIQLFF